MFSRILVKLVDEAIFPAVMLLSTRLISMFLITQYLGTPFEIRASGMLFTSLHDYVLINSYSILFMTIALAMGLVIILLKSFVFHDSHIKPEFSAKLHALRIPSLISNSFEIYSTGIIWLSYLYLLLIVSSVMALFGVIYGWVLFTILFITITSTALFIIDVEHELKIRKSTEVEYDPDSEYLETEEE